MQLLQEFVDFHRLESTAARNLMLIESLEKKLDSVALGTITPRNSFFSIYNVNDMFISVEVFNDTNPRPEGIPRPDEVSLTRDFLCVTCTRN